MTCVPSKIMRCVWRPYFQFFFNCLARSCFFCFAIASSASAEIEEEEEEEEDEEDVSGWIVSLEGKLFACAILMGEVTFLSDGGGKFSFAVDDNFVSIGRGCFLQLEEGSKVEDT